jgi:hypothetical protein
MMALCFFQKKEKKGWLFHRRGILSWTLVNHQRLPWDCKCVIIIVAVAHSWWVLYMWSSKQTVHSSYCALHQTLYHTTTLIVVNN